MVTGLFGASYLFIFALVHLQTNVPHKLLVFCFFSKSLNKKKLPSLNFPLWQLRQKARKIKWGPIFPWYLIFHFWLHFLINYSSDMGSIFLIMILLKILIDTWTFPQIKKRVIIHLVTFCLAKVYMAVSPLFHNLQD